MSYGRNKTEEVWLDLADSVESASSECYFYDKILKIDGNRNRREHNAWGYETETGARDTFSIAF